MLSRDRFAQFRQAPRSLTWRSGTPVIR